MKSSASIQIMLSRSSSSYQPLDGGVVESGSTLHNASGGRHCRASPSAVAPGFEEEEPRAGSSHEMTSIAVISSHPLRSGQPAVNTQILSAANKPPDDFANMCGSEEKTSWTNFHFVMCIGILGFFVFWIVLLCRMYLPTEYQFWNAGAAGRVPPPPEVASAERLPAKVEILDSLPNLGE